MKSMICKLILLWIVKVILAVDALSSIVHHQLSSSQLTSSRIHEYQKTFLTGTSTTNYEGWNRRLKNTKLNLRNFDLPETLIFYGMDTIIDTNNYEELMLQDSIHCSANDLIGIYTTKHKSNQKLKLRPGVIRLMKESQDINTPIIILSEHLTMEQIQSMLMLTDECDELDKLAKDDIFYYRSCLEEYKVDYSKLLYEKGSDGNHDNDDDDYDELEYEYPSTFTGLGIGHAPSPAALMDAINSIFINPRGFGGSSGFGTKYADALRNPLPQHCVVFVSKSSDKNPLLVDKRNNAVDDGGSGSISRDRCIASRTAGMRVMYLEDGCLGACTAEDVSDGIIDTLGTEDDWEMVTMDDISTPGSFWLNMAQPKDEEGNRVNAFDVVENYHKLRKQANENSGIEYPLSSDIGVSGQTINNDSDEIDDEEIQRILADISPL